MNADQARGLLDVVVGTIEREAVGTDKVIGAIPDAKRDYKPEPKSRSAWELATHLAMSDVWFADSVLNGAFVWAGEPPLPAQMTNIAGVVSWHQSHMKDRIAKLRAMKSEQLLKPVDFFGTSAPAVVWLMMMNNHAVHHRGQLAAYLRPLGSKVPAIYGMSADEPMQHA